MITNNHIKVGMADLQVLKGDGALKTVGLGSCVGLTLFDSKNRVAGMAHIMLPSSDISREVPLNKAKYANTAIPVLIEKMIQLGASKSLLAAKMAGGAQMFTFASQSDMMRIGPRNVEACKRLLMELHIQIIAEDTGGNYGRTIELNTYNGLLSIRSVNQEAKEL